MNEQELIEADVEMTDMPAENGKLLTPSEIDYYNCPSLGTWYELRWRRWGDGW
jgi:hypothetical protein